MNKPRIIVWDIETGYNVATIFQLLNKNMITHKAIQQERYIICGCYKELGAKQVKSIALTDYPKAFQDDCTDDYYVVRDLHEMLSGADAIIHHFGDRFDIKFFNARAIYHGFEALPNIVQVDTYKIAKNKFLFNSNSLDYLGKYLGLGGKISTDWSLWTRCWKGETKAVKEMIRYCKQDVNLLEKVYIKLAPYAPAKLNYNLFVEQRVCPLCGSYHLTKEKRRLSRTGWMQQVKCGDCGHYSSYPVSSTGREGTIR